MEVWRPVQFHTSGFTYRVDIDTVTGEGGDKDFVVDLELSVQAGVLCDLLANCGALGGAPPVEVFVLGQHFCQMMLVPRIQRRQIRMQVDVYFSARPHQSRSTLFRPCF